MLKVLSMNIRQELKLREKKKAVLMHWERHESDWYAMGHKIPLTTFALKLLSFIPSLAYLKIKKKNHPTWHRTRWSFPSLREYWPVVSTSSDTKTQWIPQRSEVTNDGNL